MQVGPPVRGLRGVGARRWIVLLVAVACLSLLVAVLPLREWGVRLLETMARLGPSGAVAYAAIYAAACVLMVPGSLLTLGAGFLYGTLGGLLVVIPGSLVGSTACFLLARTFARSWVAGRLASSPRFAAIDRAVERRGLRTVLLLRMSPILPYNALNYALGLTSVRLRDYVVGSAIGSLPITLLVVHAGSLASSLAGLREAGPRGPVGVALVVVGIVALVAVVIVVTRAARQALDETLTEGSPR